MRRSAGNVTLNTIKNFMFYILTYLKSRNYNTNVWLRTYIDYTDYADILTTLRWLHWYTDYTDCADILTTLTTLIYWLRWYIDYTDYADILTTLTTLIYWLHWLRWYIDYADYADIQLYMKNNFIIDYTDYAVMKGYYWWNIHQWLRWYSRVIVITDYVDYPVLHVTIKTLAIFFRNFGVVLHPSLAAFFVT